MKSKIIGFLLLVTLIISFAFVNAETIPVDVLLNKGLQITYNYNVQKFKNASGVEVFPISYEGTTYLPIRAVSSLFKMGIEYDGNTNSIFLDQGNVDTVASEKIDKFVAGELEYISALINKEVSVYYKGEKQSFKDANGVEVFPISYEGTTYLPVRAISNLFSASISWDGDTNTVAIVYNPQKDTPEPQKEITETLTYSEGHWDGNTYVFEYFGFKLKMPSGWQQIDGFTSESLATIISSDATSSIQIIASYVGNDYTVDQFLQEYQQLLSQIDTLNYTFEPVQDVNVSGVQFKCLKSKAFFLTDILQDSYCKKVGDYIVSILYTNMGSNVKISDVIEKI